jgi:hypothetical protein
MPMTGNERMLAWGSLPAEILVADAGKKGNQMRRRRPGKRARWSVPVVTTLAVLLSTVVGLEGAARPAGSVPFSPEWSATMPWDQWSSPTIADVDGDGRNDIVFAALDGVVRVVDVNGKPLPGWPRSVGTAIDGSVSVADLDRDGTNEVIVPTGSQAVSGQHGGVAVFNRDGGLRCVVNTFDANGGGDGFRDPVHSAPAVGDVDGDGYPEIVFGSWDHRVHAVNRACREIAGFPYDMYDTIWPSPALFDVDGDGRMEIFEGIDTTPGGGAIVRLDVEAGSVRQTWRVNTDDTIWSSPAIGDIDADGYLELVVGGGQYYSTVYGCCRADSRKLFALHLTDGSAVPGWPVTLNGWTSPSVALGDVNGDGRTDVVAATWSTQSNGNGSVTALDGRGRTIWGPRYLAGQTVGSPIVGDVNGDGRNDVGIGDVNGFQLFDGRTGGPLVSLNGGQSYWNAGAIGGFGAAGWRLVTLGFNSQSHVSRIEAVRIPKPGRKPPWPMFHKNAAHTGAPGPNDRCRPSVNPKANPKAVSANGYWVVDIHGNVFALHAPYLGGPKGAIAGQAALAIDSTASGKGYYVLSSGGNVHVYGDAKYYGDTRKIRLNKPVVDLQPTPTGKGYWVLAKDGGVFSFGDAKFHGSTGAMPLNKPVIGMAATKTGKGYWLVASDGGIFAFGDAKYYGSTGAIRLNSPIVSMAVAPAGTGYWLVGADGGIFAFHVPFYGSAPGIGFCTTPRGTQMRSTLTGKGYYVLVVDGRVLRFGDAKGYGRARTGWATDLTVRPY